MKTFKEMVEYAKKNPGKLSYGSAGLGTATHLRIEMLKYRAGIDILHVPYRGSADALNDLLPNTIQMMNEINVIPHVKAGKLILLDINHSQRHPDFPDVPTLTELGHPNSDVPIWFSVWAPAGTPREIVDKLNARMVEIAKSDDMKARMASINVVVPIQIARGNRQAPRGGHQEQRRGDQGRQHQAGVGAGPEPPRAYSQPIGHVPCQPTPRHGRSTPKSGRRDDQPPRDKCAMYRRAEETASRYAEPSPRRN